jgi:hypothetical protein
MCPKDELGLLSAGCVLAVVVQGVIIEEVSHTFLTNNGCSALLAVPISPVPHGAQHIGGFPEPPLTNRVAISFPSVPLDVSTCISCTLPVQ